MALYLNGKKVDRGTDLYANNIPMSPSDSDTIAEKFEELNSAEIPIQSGSATNTKDYIDTGLSGKQNTINEGYEIAGLSTPTGITRQNGGYCKIGNLVVVNVRLNLTSNVPAETDIISGFPLPVGANNMVAVTLNKDTYAVMTTSGAIRVVGNSLTYGICVATVVYMTAIT